MNNEICSHNRIRKKYIQNWILLQLHSSIACPFWLWVDTGSTKGNSSPLGFSLFGNTEINWQISVDLIAWNTAPSSAFHRSRCKAIGFCPSLSSCEREEADFARELLRCGCRVPCGHRAAAGAQAEPGRCIRWNPRVGGCGHCRGTGQPEEPRSAPSPSTVARFTLRSCYDLSLKEGLAARERGETAQSLLCFFLWAGMGMSSAEFAGFCFL